jgi:hypothetical protein
MISVAITSTQTSTGSVVQATVSGGTPPYSYAWGAPNVQSVLNPALSFAPGLSFANAAFPVTGITIWDGGIGGGTLATDFETNLTINTGGSFTVTCEVFDSASNSVTETITVPGADRRFCYFNADSDADLIAGGIPPTLIPAYNALTDGATKADLITQASIDIDRAMRYQGRRYDTIRQVTEFPRVSYEPSNAILPNTGAAGIPGGSAFGSTIWDVDPVTLNIVIPSRVLQAVIHQANYLAGGENSQVTDQFIGVTSQGTGSLHRSYGKSKALETGLCRRAYQVMQFYRLTSGRYM